MRWSWRILPSSPHDTDRVPRPTESRYEWPALWRPAPVHSPPARNTRQWIILLQCVDWIQEIIASEWSADMSSWQGAGGRKGDNCPAPTLNFNLSKNFVLVGKLSSKNTKSGTQTETVITRDVLCRKISTSCPPPTTPLSVEAQYAVRIVIPTISRVAVALR